MRRREAAQRLMRAVFVVIDEPTFSDCLDLLKVGEQICIEHFGAVGAIKALDKGVLIRLSRLDIADRNALGRGPLVIPPRLLLRSTSEPIFISGHIT